MPLISVIIPNFDGARWIGRSIASVLAQTYGDLGLLVVDDGSQGASLDVIAAFADARIRVHRQDHAGVCAARNLGIEHARGDLVAFLDSNDTWSPAFLERLSAALVASPDAALAYCGWQNVGYEGGSGKPSVLPDYETAGKLEAVFRNSCWPIHAMLTRREAVRGAGAFDPRFPTSEDLPHWLKILAAREIVRVPEVLAFYHHDPGSRATADEVCLAFNQLDAKRAFLNERPDGWNRLGRDKVRDLTYGELLRRANACYWRGHLPNARRIFRRVMLARYGDATDLKRMLLTLVSLRLHRLLVQRSRTGDRIARNDAHGCWYTSAERNRACQGGGSNAIVERHTHLCIPHRARRSGASRARQLPYDTMVCSRLAAFDRKPSPLRHRRRGCRWRWPVRPLHLESPLSPGVAALGRPRSYRDVLSEWGLDQSVSFPRVELSYMAPSVSAPGVYVYWYGKNVVVRAYGRAETGLWKCSLRMRDSLKIVAPGRLKVDLRPPATEGAETRLDVAPEVDGQLVLAPGGQVSPLVFEISAGITPDPIFVGRRKVSPGAASFALAMQDRHAMSRADLNGDGMLDAFVTRGALGGTFRALPPEFAQGVRDELLVSTPGRTYVDTIGASGIEKKDCSGQHAQYVDFDGDGRLDLFVNCYNRANVPGDYRKQVYRRDSTGHFLDVAAQIGLALPAQHIGSFARTDADGDGLPGLVTFQDECFSYRNHFGRFTQETVLASPMGNAERIGQTEGNRWLFDGKVVAADFDLNGYPDVFSSSRRSNTLIVNYVGNLSAIAPPRSGFRRAA